MQFKQILYRESIIKVIYKRMKGVIVNLALVVRSFSTAWFATEAALDIYS